jgi:hypothetical protein
LADGAPVIQGKTAALSSGTVTTSAETGWAQTGRLAVERLLHTSTRLQDGRVLTVGGYNPTAELYNPVTGTWSRTADAPANYRGATATLLPSGKVLIAGTSSSGISTAVYDPTSGTWARPAGLAKPRAYHTATSLPDGRVLVMGGESGGSALASAELYDPASDTWTPTGALKVARSRHTATLLSSGLVLVTGGAGSAGATASAELYDPATGTWTLVGNMATARSKHAATALPSGLVLVTGGAQSGEPSSRAELFDPATRTWRATGSMGQPRRLHSATLMPSGLVLVSGGYDETLGIETSAELYDPARGTWMAMPSLGVPRYQHTATLLANGRVLVAGGFSTGDQASAELFSAPYVQVALDSGEGWKRMNVSGSISDDNHQAFNKDLYLVSGATGVANAPLPESVRAELAQESATSDTLYFLDQKILEELALAQQTGTLTPALQAIAEPQQAPASGFQASSDQCPDQVVTVASKTYDLLQHLNHSKDLGGGFTGSLGTTGDLQANVTAEVNMAVQRTPLGPWCIPYGAGFDSIRAHGIGELNYGATLQGTLNYAQAWEFPIDKPHLASFTFMAGPVPVHIGLNLPITAGINLNATATGQLSYTSEQSASVSFDTKCRLQGCTASANVSSPDADSLDANASIQGRIQPSVWAQAALRVFLYDELLVHAQAGVKPSLDGDLWGYVGSNCGDADGDGVEEFVRAATFNLDWRVNVTGEVWALGLSKKSDKLWTTGPMLIFFKNLNEQTSGGSTALIPMLTGPATTGQYLETAYTAKMRPCWPYDKNITYRLDWGDGTSDANFTGQPGSALIRKHQWRTAGDKTVRLTALKDAHGRTLNGTFERIIHVNAQPAPALSVDIDESILAPEAGDSVTFTALTQGTGPFSYQWSTGATGSTTTRTCAYGGQQLAVSVQVWDLTTGETANKSTSVTCYDPPVDSCEADPSNCDPHPCKVRPWLCDGDE